MDPNAKPAGEPTPAPEAQETFSRAEVTALVNQAITSHTKRLEAKFAESLEGIKQLLAQKPAEPSPDAAKTVQVDPEIVKLREALDRVKQENERERSARVQSEERARAQAEDAALRDAIARNGIRPELRSAAFHMLKAEMQRDEEGNAKLAIKRVRERGRPAEAVPFSIDDGVQDWIKSDEAKAFLPPPTTPAKPTTAGRAPSVAAASAQRADASFDASLAAAAEALSNKGITPADVINR